MVRVEVEYKGVKGIMTDGYFPSSFSYYKDIDWKVASKGKFPLSDNVQLDVKRNIYKRFMTPGVKTPKAGPRSNFYRKMERLLENRFCEYRKERCFQFQYPDIGIHRMERFILDKPRDIQKEILPVFSREIKHNLAIGKDTYVFHLAYLDLNPENYCPSYKECTKNWMDFMGFEIKKEEEYVDFEAYKNAAENLLKKDIQWEDYAIWFEKKY